MSILKGRSPNLKSKKVKLSSDSWESDEDEKLSSKGF